MTKIPRPGHADYLYQAKYGIRAASGGGRSSARETIGRVAAGAVAEKWLRQQFGTEIVSFVSSVGYILLAPEGHRNSEGKPWTRAEVDIRGTLRLIAGEHYSKALKEGADEAALKQAREQDEAVFVAAGPPPAREGERPPPGTFAQPASASSSSSSSAGVASGAATGSSASTGAAGAPCYVDSEGNLYDREGSLTGKCGEAAPTVDSLGTVSPPTGEQTEAARKVLPGLTDDVVQVRCPCPSTSARMATLIRWIKSQKDSTGGTLACTCSGVPIGLGEPCFDKLEAQLAHAMLSLPATKGFEIGSGFDGTRLRGSLHNDMFAQAGDAPASWTGQAEKAVLAATSAATSATSSSSSSSPPGAGPVQVHGTMTQGKVLLRPATNRAGGTLGGISTGADIEFRVAIKPVSTIGREQKTAGFDGGVTELKARGRHDPCVLPRAPPLVEGMAALVLADAALVQATRRPPVTFAQAVATSVQVATGSGGEAVAAIGEKRSMGASASGASASGSGAAAEESNGVGGPAAAKKARTEPA